MSTQQRPKEQSPGQASPQTGKRRRLRFSPTRSQESVDFDTKKLRSRYGHFFAPQYEHWNEFYANFAATWNSDPEYGAEHVIVVGQAGSGKTTLARELLQARDYVIVLGTKTRDPSLYDPLLKQGYTLQDNFDPTDLKHPKVIFRPPLDEPTVEALTRQRRAFREALLGIFNTGGWSIFCDELRYLTDTLKLNHEMDLLWLQGRSLWITIIGLTQRPVSVPLNAFEQATHFFLFRISGLNDRKRASEYTGTNAPVVFETVKALPHHEFLYVDKTHDELVRSRVERTKSSGSQSGNPEPSPE